MMTWMQRCGFAFLLSGFLSLFQPCFADPPLPTPVGRVVWVKGSLKAVMPNKEERILQKMSVLYLHDILVTDAKSRGEIIFTDQSLITFYPNSKLAIDQYVYKPKSKTGSHYLLNLIEGGFRTITGLIAKTNPTNYQVNTPVATIGVRGTDYVVRLKDKRLYVGYYNGSPCVTGRDKNKTELCLSNNKQYAEVSTDGMAPVPLFARPEVFAETLEITPFSISSFGVSGLKQGGVVSSFCIMP
jgi:hypothetical protein